MVFGTRNNAGNTDSLHDTFRAPVPAIVDVLLDFESYPEWTAGMLETTVQSRDADGRGDVVEMYVDAKVKKVRYRVKYVYDLDHGKLGFDLVDGDLTECTGRYELTANDDGTTDVALDMVTEVGFPVPGPLKKMIRDQAIKNSIRDLKKRVGG